MSTRNQVFRVFALLGLVLSLLLPQPASVHAARANLPSGIVFVKADASGDQNGTSWENAFTDLQAGINAASSGEQVWVASGEYKPATDSNRDASFVMKEGVKIYGSFDGHEDNLSQRPLFPTWLLNPSILSGDIGAIGDTTDNSYHVIKNSWLSAAAVLDGFFITNGNANNGSTCPSACGGGMYNAFSSPTLANLFIWENTANLRGGGMYNAFSSPVLNDVFILNNQVVSGSGGGMYNHYSSPALTGVTFDSNAASISGGGMHNSHSQPTLNTVNFYSNTADDGGGIFNAFSSITLTNQSRFEGNTAGDSGGAISSISSSLNLSNVFFNVNSATNTGGAIYNQDSSAALINIVFRMNSASDGGAIFNDSSSPTLTNTAFDSNSASGAAGGGYGGGIYNVDSSPIVTNATFDRNTASVNGGAIANFHISAPVVGNSIMWGSPVEPVYNAGANSSTVITYSIVQGGYPGTGNLDEAPQFYTMSGNLRLLGTSPAKNAGSNALLPADTQDLDSDGDKTEKTPLDLTGRPRLAHEIVDIGAYEIQIIYVDGSATSGKNNGTSWADAFTHLQDNTNSDPNDGINAAIPGEEVWVAAGVYQPNTKNADPRKATFVLKEGVGVYGGFAGSETLLEQRDWQANLTTLSGDIGVSADMTDNSYHVIQYVRTFFTTLPLLTSATRLDGFTISGGNANNTNDEVGGGILFVGAGSPTLTNITFSGNAASNSGGAMYNSQSNPTLTNVTLSENNAKYGAGIANNGSSPSLTDVTFHGNTASNSGGDHGAGGALYNWESSPTITNVTFSGNTALGAGGGIYNGSNSNPTLTDVTFSGNNSLGFTDNGHTFLGSGGAMINTENASPTLTNVTFSGNTSTGGGGAISNQGMSNMTLTNVTFNGNSANTGGAMIVGRGNPTLVNVSFIRNTATSIAGGLYNSAGYSNEPSSLTLINVLFNGNTAAIAGGMYNSGQTNTTLTNVVFSGNNATNYGGGMANADCSPTLTNVTFSGNAAGNQAGGMRNSNSSPLVRNSIFWGNSLDQIYNQSGSSPDIAYSDVQGGYDGEGNLAMDPLFVRSPSAGADGTWGTDDDDYGDAHLRATSPVTNMGSDAALPLDIADLDEDGDKTEPLPFDLAGTVRILGASVDMGAYENPFIFQTHLPTIYK